MNTLILTVGLPRSGKSTWARSTGFPIVNPDAIRFALHGQPFVKEAEGMVWTIAKYMVRSLFLAGHTTVILDATNTLARNRSEWNSADWIVEYSCFKTDAAECIKRALVNKQDYLLPVIERMNRQMEWPTGNVLYEHVLS
jgi:predicted kinase